MNEREQLGDLHTLTGDAGLFRDLLDAAPDAMLIVDAGGRIVLANAQSEILLGYLRDELVGQSVEVLVPAALRAQHVRHRDAYAAAPRKRPMGIGLDLLAVRKDGGEIPVEISLGPLRTPVGTLYLAAIRDVTHRVEVERELRAARAQAEQASSAKSRFLAAASHDLRQPLQAALLYNNVLERQVRESEHAATARKLGSSLEALRDLLNRLLDISRLEAGSITPEIDTVLLRILFERLRDEFTPQAAEKGLSLHVRPGDFEVASDPQLLEQLLRNLVANALRYTERGRVLVGCRRAGREVRIQVWDTGIGIAESDLPAIFEEFYQVADSRRGRHLGLGLGLAIVRRLSKILDHPVTVRSTIGRGSVFEVRVPRASVAAERSARASQTATARRRALVAVIEDDDEVRDGLRMSLEQSGHEVLAAADAGSVLRAARAVGRVPDLIVSDYQLGDGCTGLDAIAMLRRDLGAAIQAVVVTGDSSVETLARVRDAGFTLFQKPVDAERLEEAIAAAVSGAVPAAAP